MKYPNWDYDLDRIRDSASGRFMSAEQAQEASDEVEEFHNG